MLLFCFSTIDVCVADALQDTTLPLLVVKSGRAGFINAEGKLLVSPRYVRCGRWSEGRLWVQEQASANALGTFLDARAKQVSPMQFYDLAAVRPELPLPHFEKGVAVIGTPEGGFAYLDVQGQMLGRTTRSGAFQRQDGELLLCVVSNRIGFIDRSGKTVIPPHYDEATPFYGGRAGVRQGTQWGLIDGTGGWIVNPAFESLRPASDDARIWAYQQSGRLGVIDHTGKKLTAALYSDVGTYRGGAISVQGSTGWGLVAEDGSELIKPQYASLWPFGKDDNLWMAQSVAGKWGVVATNGHVRVSCHFDFVMAATPEVWLAQQSGLWGILDPETGRWRVPAMFNRMLPQEPPFKNKVLVEQSSRWGLFDGETGKQLIETRYERIGQWGTFLAVEKEGSMKLLDADFNEVLLWKGSFEGLPDYATLTDGSGLLVTEQGVMRITRDGKMLSNNSSENVEEKVQPWRGLVPMMREGLWGLVDLNGRDVLSCEYDTIEWGFDEEGSPRFYGVDLGRTSGLEVYGR